ncbi:MAG TPA: carbonic anhydrase family protein [Steroidobacteraceae bacterium]|nr:carbonic anhydrase family protein [Steroidobacteraceae bacterium]
MRRGAKSLLAAIAMGLLLSTGALAFADESGAHWSYSGATGPEHWGTLEKDYSSCALGKTESPIDIPDDVATKADLPAIHFDYKSSTLRIIDNGHTIQINYAPGSFIEVGGQRYQLVQFHFHRPSEEEINGKRYDMVAHLVHRNSNGQTAVVAVLLTHGAANPLIKTLWEHLPQEKNHEVAVDAVNIDAAALLPRDKGYYTFAGSLTTPPCTEGVTWFVLRTPTPMSAEQLARFAAVYPMNARPVQALNHRQIKASQ